MLKKFHYFMDIGGSPWPTLISFSILSTFISFLIFVKFNLMVYFFNFLTNMFILSILSFFWWKDYENEYNYLGLESLNLESLIKIGMILFISSELMLFISLFWTYLEFFLSPSMEIGFSWPSSELMMFEWDLVPMVNTIILLSSSVTLTVCHLEFNKNNFMKSLKFIKVTVALGLLFTFFQYMEYKNSLFCISDSIFGSSFFLLTGLHGSHVLIGSIYLSYCFKKLKSKSVSFSNSINLELSSWYWHFVDLIWIYVFYLLYYLMKI